MKHLLRVRQYRGASLSLSRYHLSFLFLTHRPSVLMRDGKKRGRSGKHEREATELERYMCMLPPLLTLFFFRSMLCLSVLSRRPYFKNNRCKDQQHTHTHKEKERDTHTHKTNRLKSIRLKRQKDSESTRLEVQARQIKIFRPKNTLSLAFLVLCKQENLTLFFLMFLLFFSFIENHVRSICTGLQAI